MKTTTMVTLCINLNNKCETIENFNGKIPRVGETITFEGRYDIRKCYGTVSKIEHDISMVSGHGYEVYQRIDIYLIGCDRE